MATDSEIARTDGKLSGEKDLVPWNDDGEMGDICTESLEDNRRQSNGWQSADMFKYNETVFNISSTYRDEMPEYTYVIFMQCLKVFYFCFCSLF